MTTYTVIPCTLEELTAKIQEVVRQELQAKFDRPVTRKEVAQMWGCTEKTVSNCEKRGELIRINKDSMRPKYSLNQVMQLKKYEKI